MNLCLYMQNNLSDFLNKEFINPLNAELIPICYLLALLELTIFSTLAG